MAKHKTIRLKKPSKYSSSPRVKSTKTKGKHKTIKLESKKEAKDRADKAEAAFLKKVDEGQKETKRLLRKTKRYIRKATKESKALKGGLRK